MSEQQFFGSRLRELRIERGLSQAALAGDEISTGYLSRIESGARQPTERVTEYLARRLGVPVSAFGQPETRPLAQVLASVASTVEDEQSASLLADAVKAEGEKNSLLRWQALWRLAGMMERWGRHNEEREYLRDLLTLSDELDMPELRARARTKSARCLLALGEVGEACTVAAEAHAIADEYGLSALDKTLALRVLVSVEAEAGRLQDARAHADLLSALADETAGTVPVEALWTAATVHIRQGDSAGAQGLLDRALQEMDSHDDLVLWMRLRLAVASLSLQMKPPDTEKAAGCLAEAETVLWHIGSVRHQHELLLLKAQLAYHAGRIGDANQLIDQLSRSDLRLSFRDQVRFEVLRNRLLIQQGQSEQAISNLRELAQRANDTSNVDLAADIWRTLAEMLVEMQPHTSERPEQ